MASDRSDMHIVLNEEVIDLRQETFDKRPHVKNRSPHKTTSQQILSPSQNADLKDRKPLRVNGLRRLANNLYLGEQSVLQKNKGNLRSKPRNRATSADPRFRRERSPICTKEANQTQSDSQVMDLPTQFKKKKNKTHSDSNFILEDSPSTKRSVPKPNGPYPTDQSEPVNKTDLEMRHGPSREEAFHEDAPKKGPSTKYSTISNIYSCGTLTPSNLEQSTMTEEARTFPTAMTECRSLYHSAITDSEFTRNKPELDLYNGTGMYLDDKESSRQSYWDDPRLIEKYSRLLKPVGIHKTKSSLTLPLSKSNTAGSYIKPRAPVCSKCVCADELEETQDFYEEINSETVNYERIKSKLYKAVSSNYYLAAFFMIGSLCGIMLVTLVGWVVANDIIWSCLNKQEQQQPTGIKWLAAYIGGGILHSIHVIVNKLCHMIVMPRNEMFDAMRMDEIN